MYIIAAFQVGTKECDCEQVRTPEGIKLGEKQHVEVREGFRSSIT